MEWIDVTWEDLEPKQRNAVSISSQSLATSNLSNDGLYMILRICSDPWTLELSKSDIDEHWTVTQYALQPS